MDGLKICTRCRAISALRRRRINSSLLPENIGPTTTSIQPMLPLTMSTHRLLERPNAKFSRTRYRTASANSQICHSEPRSLLERGEEPDVSPAHCEKQIPHPQKTRVRDDEYHGYPAAWAAGLYILTL